MDDERIEHALKLGPIDEPAYQRGVRARMGATHDSPAAGPSKVMSSDDEPALAPPTRIDVRPRAGGSTFQAPRLATLAQLAAVLTIAVIAAAVALPGLVGSPPSSGDMLGRLRDSGSIRMLVPDSEPQTVTAGGVRIGFDIDVANALAGELLLEPDVRPIAVDADAPASTWDVSAGMRDVGTSGASQPYGYWPAWLATGPDSGIRTVDAIAGHPICVVGGTAAEGWVPAGAQIVRTGSDDECVAALADGRADALVTNLLFDDELGSRGLVAVGTEPVAWEPRVVRVSATGEDAVTLLAAINGAIDDLRATGQLADLSRRSFGGRDITEVRP